MHLAVDRYGDRNMGIETGLNTLLSSGQNQQQPNLIRSYLAGSQVAQNNQNQQFQNNLLQQRQDMQQRTFDREDQQFQQVQADKTQMGYDVDEMIANNPELSEIGDLLRLSFREDPKGALDMASKVIMSQGVETFGSAFMGEDGFMYQPIKDPNSPNGIGSARFDIKGMPKSDQSNLTRVNVKSADGSTSNQWYTGQGELHHTTAGDAAQPIDLSGNFDNEGKLRGEFNTQSKPFTLINDAFGRIIAAGQDPSPAGDLALIFNYMKMLDPGSTVREGEFATAQQSGSLDDRIVAQYNSIVEGTRLSPPQRADFLDRSQRLYNQATQTHQGREAEYTGLAERNKLNPANVVINRSMFGENEFNPLAPVAQPDSETGLETFSDAMLDGVDSAQIRTGTFQDVPVISLDNGLTWLRK